MNSFIEKTKKQLELMTEKEKESQKSFLSGTWSQISDLILDLRNEPYIDEQVQIEEIYDNDFYDYYGIYDPMKDLANAICVTKEENLGRADIMKKQWR